MQKRKLEIVIHRSHIFSSSKVHIDKQRSESKSYFLKKQETFVHWVEIPNFPNCFVINLLLVQEEAMFRDLVLHIQDIIGSRTCWDLKITSQSFILQKKTQDYLKSSLKNSHFCQDLMHIDHPQSHTCHNADRISAPFLHHLRWHTRFELISFWSEVS